MIKSFLTTAITMLAIDAFWLVSMKATYDKWLSSFDRIINWPAVGLVYFFIPFGLTWLVVSKNLGQGITTKALLDSFVYGICAYAVYDLTNLATLKNWSITMTIVDIIWGGVLCTITTAAALFILNKF